MLPYRAMATLKSSSSGDLIVLRSTHLVGRSRRCDLRVTDPKVSGQHASLRWTGEDWELMDLGSRNGCWVKDKRVEPGSRVRLAQGDSLAFGDSEQRWELRSAGPPVAQALTDDGQELLAQAGLLVLGREGQELVQVFRDSAGGWVAETADRVEPVEDEQQLMVGGVRYRLALPLTLPETVEAQDAPSIDAIRLSFSVSRDEEHVELQALHRDEKISLGARSHNYMLLTLARLRLEDQQDPELSASSHGWVDVDVLLNMLRVAENKLNVDIFRARKAAQKAGIEDAAGLVERRAYRRQLRMGVGELSVRVI